MSIKRKVSKEQNWRVSTVSKVEQDWRIVKDLRVGLFRFITTVLVTKPGTIRGRDGSQ